jgi:parallel beta-helix repeat protein
MPTGRSARLPTLFNAALVLAAALFGPATVHGAHLFVDQKISVTMCTTYYPATRSCGAGYSRAYRTLAGAAAAAVAGDAVYLRAGTYTAQLSPARSGTASLPITFTAFGGETPTLAGNSNPAIWLIGRSNIIVDGLTVTQVGGWGRLEDATYNIIRNCTFTYATIWGTTGGLKLVRSKFNKIINNTFYGGNDNITVQDSNQNVIRGNRISKARHSLLSIRCGSYNIVRGNVFSNTDQKDLEIYDCEGTSDAPYKLNATKRNLIENNVIVNSRASTDMYDFNGIQLAGQEGIFRRNVFHSDHGGGVNFQYYSNESLYNNRNRLYNNTFYDNDCYGIVGASGSSSTFFDNRVLNNILYRNTTCSGAATQVYIKNSSQVILSNNAITTTSPGFVNVAAYDLHLASGSPMIDKGAFLTTTTAAGSGTSLPVADMGYFYGGYGIPGELGDQIRLQGQTTVARVIGGDSARKLLFLDRSLTWAAGTGVALRYNGARPDLGAYEY